MNDQQILDAIRSRLTVEIWPVAGRALGYRTKGAAYAAEKRGAIRTVEGQGRRKQVPTAWLRRVLYLDHAPESARVQPDTAGTATTTP